jgi:hypothetical protein
LALRQPRRVCNCTGLGLRLAYPFGEPVKGKSKPEPKARKLTIRITTEDYEKLCELKLALHLASDGAALRALIRLHHKYATTELRRARREPGHKDRVQAMVDRRQLGLFPAKGGSA